MYSLTPKGPIKAVIVPHDFTGHVSKVQKSNPFIAMVMRMCPRRRKGFLPMFRNEELDKMA